MGQSVKFQELFEKCERIYPDVFAVACQKGDYDWQTDFEIDMHSEKWKEEDDDENYDKNDHVKTPLNRISSSKTSNCCANPEDNIGNEVKSSHTPINTNIFVPQRVKHQSIQVTK